MAMLNFEDLGSKFDGDVTFGVGGRRIEARARNQDAGKNDEAEVAAMFTRAQLDEAVAQANERQNAAWRLMCEKMVAAERGRAVMLRTVSIQVLRDMRAQDVLMEWQTLLDDALMAAAAGCSCVQSTPDK